MSLQARRRVACAARDARRPARCRTAPRRCLRARACCARPSAGTVPSTRAPPPRVAGYGVHSSKIITMSESSTRWMRMLSSGPRNTVRAVGRRGEGHALLGDLAAVRQREHLEAAGVGEDRPVPAREAVQAAVRFDHVQARAQVQMEGVAEDDLGAELADLFGQHALDRTIGADRHERRRFHRAARESQPAAARGAVGLQPRTCSKRHAAHARSPARHGHVDGHSNIASP